MPAFDETARSDAPPEEVWKLLYDPSRFPEWWVGVETVETADAADVQADPGAYTMYPDGYPDFPMPQLLRASQQDHRVMVSCLVSDLRFDWRLRPDGAGAEIHVHVEIPEQEAARLTAQQDAIRRSVARLAALAACQP